MAAAKKHRRKTDVGNLLDRLASEEQRFLERPFLAPAMGGPAVRVRIAGMNCTLRVEPTDFAGWGIFQPLSHGEAILVRPATLAERRSYLDLFPVVRLIACWRVGSSWFGSAAHSGDTRICLTGLAPINLIEDIQLFDSIRARYDGARFWFDEHDMRHDPAASSYLRSSLHDSLPPEELRRPGLTAEERAAYELNYWQSVAAAENDTDVTPDPARRRRARRGRAIERSVESDLTGRRLQSSLSHAGAELVDYLERSDGFRVTFTIGGHRYTSSVSKEDLTVQVAGICLSGEDQKFDLGSLVGVLREGESAGEIHRVGD